MFTTKFGRKFLNWKNYMPKTIESIVLAAGLGSRMGDLTKNQQKCLLPVEGEPALYWIVTSLLQAFGTLDLKVAVGYLAKDVKEFLDKRFGKNKALNLTYVYHKGGQGTLAAYRSMLPYVRGALIGLPGDVITTSESYANALSDHYRAGNDLTVVVSDKTETVDSHGLITGKAGLIQTLTYPAPDQGHGWRDMNIYVAEPQIMKELRRFPEQTGAFTTFVQSLLMRQILRLGYYQSNANFLHLAYPEDLTKPLPREKNIVDSHQDIAETV